jgi:hypothetical protein
MIPTRHEAPKMKTTIAACALLSVTAASHAVPQDSPPAAPATPAPTLAQATPAPAPAVGGDVTVTLVNGDVIRAKLVAETPEAVTVKHPLMGDLVLKRTTISTMAAGLAPAAKAGPQDPEAAAKPETAEAVRKEQLGPAANDVSDAPRAVDGVNPADNAAKVDAAPAPPPPPSPWKFVLDANVNYVNAANKQLDFRVAAGAIYEIKDVEKWANSAEYFFKTVDGSTTDNNLLVSSIYDKHLESDPRVLWFVKGQAQWAPLQGFEQRLSAWGGVGYQILKKPKADVTGKIGAGYTYEFGNINEGYPQLYASIEWDWDITENQAIVGSYWITPDFADFTDFLMLARLEWTMKLPDIPGLKLLGGARWQYQSQVPTGDVQNDIRVYAGLRLEI